MDPDFLGHEIKEALKTLMKDIIDMFNGICKGLKVLWDETKKFIDSIQGYEHKPKPKHKPTMKILPNKAILLEKRPNIHYCRNTC